MTFISYAQNFEDVMLWRALKHIKNGFYVDIGAQHPLIDSVSKGFYENGWRGIHIEPVRQYADLLRNDRPDETVLEIAISDRDGLLELNVIADSGLSTGVKSYAESHERQLGFGHRTVSVPMLPIRSALASLAGRPVHWLKIDIEGLEEQALGGWDSQTLRPWIIVVEATVPLSTELSKFDMDGLLADASYVFAYFDGLNRFYVAKEHSELLDCFTTPPNIFDGVALSGTSTASWCRVMAAQRENENKELVAQLQEIEAESATSARQSEQRFNELSGAVAQAEGRAELAETRLASVAGDLARVERALAGATERAELAETRLASVAGDLARVERALAGATERAASQTARAELAEHEVRALRTSTSWRLTYPLRLVVAAARGQLSRSQVDRLGALARRYGLFTPARALYRMLGGSRTVAALAADSPVVSAAAHVAPTAASARGLPSEACYLSDDARSLLRQLSPHTSAKEMH